MLVEDEVIIAGYLKLELELEGYIVSGFITTGEEAVEIARIDKPDVVLMDIKLAGEMDGIDAAEIISNESGTPIIFMTSYSRLEITQRAQKITPSRYFNKPVCADDLVPEIEQLLA